MVHKRCSLFDVKPPEGLECVCCNAEPDFSKLRDFLMGEVRYNSLLKTFPEEAKELFAKTEQFAKLRYEGYKKLSEEK